MSSTQEATLLSSRTTTSLRSRIVPKAAACGLLVMNPACLSPGLLVPFGSCLYPDYLLPLCMMYWWDMCPLRVICILLSRALLYMNFISIFCVVDGHVVILNLYSTLVSCAPCVYVWSAQEGEALRLGKPNVSLWGGCCVHGRVELLLGLPISLGMRGDLTVPCSDLMHINTSYLRALGFPTPGAYIYNELGFETSGFC